MGYVTAVTTVVLAIHCVRDHATTERVLDAARFQRVHSHVLELARRKHWRVFEGRQGDHERHAAKCYHAQ